MLQPNARKKIHIFGYLCYVLLHHVSWIKAYESDPKVSNHGHNIIILKVAMAFPAASPIYLFFSDSWGKRLRLLLALPEVSMEGRLCSFVSSFPQDMKPAVSCTDQKASSLPDFLPHSSSQPVLSLARKECILFVSKECQMCFSKTHLLIAHTLKEKAKGNLQSFK